MPEQCERCGSDKLIVLNGDMPAVECQQCGLLMEYADYEEDHEFDR